MRLYMGMSVTNGSLIKWALLIEGGKGSYSVSCPFFIFLGEVDNNLRYIKVVQALKHSLDKLDNMLRNNQELQRKYQAIYLSYFYTGCGFSFYDKVCNSILDYKYGNRPF